MGSMLYGVQTVCQLARDAQRKNKRNTIPCLRIRDWPDMKWRCLSPTTDLVLRLEPSRGIRPAATGQKASGNGLSIGHCSTNAMPGPFCMYGYWPFTLPGHAEETLDVDLFSITLKRGERKEAWRFVHPNIRNEFFPKVAFNARQRAGRANSCLYRKEYLQRLQLSERSPRSMPAARRK